MNPKTTLRSLLLFVPLLGVLALQVFDVSSRWNVTAHESGLDYALTFNDTTRLFDTGSGTTTVYTPSGNPVSFAYGNIVRTATTATLDPAWATFGDGGYCYNTSPISGLLSLTLSHSATDPEAISLSYGWELGVYPVTGITLESALITTFNDQSPTYFRLDVSTASEVAITTMSVTYACAVSANPYAEATAGLSVMYDSAQTAYRVLAYTGVSEQVSIPDTYNDGTHGVHPLISLGGMAFAGTNVTRVALGAHIASVDPSAFMGDFALSAIDVSSANTVYASKDGILFNHDLTSLIVYPAAKTSAHYAVLPSVTALGENAFFGVFALENITLPEGLLTIGNYCFGYDYALTGITLPSTLTALGLSPFYGCANITAFAIAGDATTPAGIWADGGVLYVASVDTPKTLFAYPAGAPATAFTVPADVIIIGDSAFSCALYLTEVSLPEGLTDICDTAFQSATAITALTLPSSLTTLHELAFSNMFSLASINLPTNLMTIPYGAFQGCMALTAIDLVNSGITTIEPYAFDQSGLTSLYLPDAVSVIGASAFAEMPALAHIDCQATGQPETWEEGWTDLDIATQVSWGVTLPA